MKKFAGISVLIVFFALPSFAQQGFPPGPGRETLQRVCTQCHDIDSLPRLRYSRADWTNLVFSMKDMGADASGAEMDQIIDYLSTNFGKGEPAAKKVNVNTAAAGDLATGLGITAKEADLIVQYRGKNGNFKDLAGLLKVEGLDAAKVQSAKDKIEF